MMERPRKGNIVLTLGISAIIAGVIISVLIATPNALKLPSNPIIPERKVLVTYDNCFTTIYAEAGRQIQTIEVKCSSNVFNFGIPLVLYNSGFQLNLKSQLIQYTNGGYELHIGKDVYEVKEAKA